MSAHILVPPDKSPLPGRVVSSVATTLTILLMLLGSLFFPAAPAQAATLGVGYGNQDLWLGSFSSHGRQAYCMDLDALAPWGNTQHPELKTTLDSLSATELARLNYVLGRWGESNDPNITSAVQLYVWDIADRGNYSARGGDGQFVTRAPGNMQATILSHLTTMRSESAANAVANPSVSMSITMTDQYQGQLKVALRNQGCSEGLKPPASSRLLAV